MRVEVRLFLLVPAILLLWSSCSRTQKATPCPPGSLAPSAWEHGLLLLGEVHGTEESPAMALATACAAARASGGAWLGLEIPRDEQPALDRFLRDGQASVLLASPWWTRADQDGRTSEAFFQLLVRLRALRLGGVPLDVVAFDAPMGAAARIRDEAMAGVIAEAAAARAGKPGIVLVGNVHATRKLQLPRPMARLLSERGLGFRTLDMAAPAGNAWLCGNTCGLQPLGAMGPPGEPSLDGFTLEGTSRGFDGWWFSRSLTPSPPAISVARN